LLRSPYLQNVQQDRASILWTTVEVGEGRVVVASPSGTTITVPATGRFFPKYLTGLAYNFQQYQADLTGLEPGTSYSYRITLNGATLTPGPARFRTAGPGKFSFLAFGDTGEDTPAQRQVINLMAAETGISFLMHTGDLAYPQGTFAHYEIAHFGLNAPLLDHLPFFPTPGNHDYYADFAAPYLAVHSMPESGVDPADRGRYYSFDWGDAHFISLDTNLIPTGSVDRMMDWFENDLRSTRKFWKIVYMHHPPYPTGHHLGDSICAAVREQVKPLVERYGVQLVIAGHEHGYERTAPLVDDTIVQQGTGTTYVITGGGGAGLHDVNSGGKTLIALEDYNYLRVDVDGRTLTIRATDADGKEIDRFELRPQPVISDRGVVSVGDYSAALAPGSLVSIFGQNLAMQQAASPGYPMPTTMGGVRVEIDDQDAPLMFVSPGQVNFQIPFDAKPSCMLRVVTDNGMDQQRVSLTPTAPTIIAVTTRNLFASPLNAPNAGTPIVIYASGLGSCGQTLVAGTPVIGATSTVAAVDVWMADKRIQPTYAGMTPGYAGLYQVNFAVPNDFTAGTYALRIATTNGSSRSVPLVVR
jgi:uncharacterized protein (TIGR03437 family)